MAGIIVLTALLIRGRVVLHEKLAGNALASLFGENFQRGGGLKKTDENSQFQFGNFENPGGGSRFFKNV